MLEELIEYEVSNSKENSNSLQIITTGQNVEIKQGNDIIFDGTVNGKIITTALVEEKN
jgi:hypothetical protein